MARPKGSEKPVNVEEIKKYARVGATQLEIARCLGISTDTLERRLQRPAYRAALNEGQAELYTSLRTKQVQLALSGNVTMLIWLGKNLLGQADKLDTKLTGSGSDGSIKHSFAVEQLKAELDAISNKLPLRETSSLTPGSQG